MSGVLGVKISNSLRATVTMGIRRMEVAVRPFIKAGDFPIFWGYGVSRILISDKMRGILDANGEDWGLWIGGGFNLKKTLDRNLAKIFAGTGMVHVKDGDTLTLLAKRELEEEGLVLKKISSATRKQISQDAPWLNTFQLDDLELKAAVERRLAGLCEHSQSRYKFDLKLWEKLLAPSVTTLQTLANLAKHERMELQRPVGRRRKATIPDFGGVPFGGDDAQNVLLIRGVEKAEALREILFAADLIAGLDSANLAFAIRRAKMGSKVLDFLVNHDHMADRPDPDLHLALLEKVFQPIVSYSALLNYLKARHEIVPQLTPDI